MNFIVCFVVLLQVLTTLGFRCYTKDKQYGICRSQNDCNISDGFRAVTKCGKTGLYCCIRGATEGPSPVASASALLVSQPVDSRAPSRIDSGVLLRIDTTAPLTVASSNASIMELKFPTNCGWTPMYPKEQIVGGFLVKANEFSWLASLHYGDKRKNQCGGSVINSRYVLTAAHCVTGERVQLIGGLTSVRLGVFNKTDDLCDYGTENCTDYQEFGIEKIIPHREYRQNLYQVVNDIALIRLDRPIEFGPNMLPICLPFGNNRIEEPKDNYTLTIAGWGLTMERVEVVGKRAATVNLWPSTRCNAMRTDNRHLCAVAPDKNICSGDSGGPLMNHFKQRFMALEGIISTGLRNCRNTEYPGVFTRVRSFEQWLNNNMEM